MNNNLKCPVCKAQYTSREILFCSHCEHIFRNFPIIDLEDYYSNKYRKLNLGGPPTDFNLLKDRNIFRLKMINNFIKDKKTIFEVGFGYGDFYKVLKDVYPEKIYSCCELDENLYKSAIDNGIEAWGCSYQDMPDKKYDTIISFDVLEHFYNPHDYKNKLVNMLDKKGIAVIQVPTDRGIHFHKPFDGHYHYFSEKSLNLLMSPEFNNLMFMKTKRGTSANGPEFLTVYEKK